MIATYLRMVVLALALLVGGCASAATAEGPRRDANQITAEELERTNYTSAFELVAALRPNWIQRRGAMSIQDPTAGEVVVYLDGMRFGGPESLRQLRVGDIALLQYLNATDASSRFGLGHTGGAILVHTKRGR